MKNEKTAKPKNSFWQDAKEVFIFAIKVLVIVVPIRMFVAQPFMVSGQSMLPTLENGDYLIIDEISYRKYDPERGQVIVFKLPNNTSRYLIKRIIGLPGEKIEITGDKVTITKKNGEILQLDEKYTNGAFSSYGTWNLGETEYFVMGDNRNNSSDSRSWGVLDRKYIVGKTFLRLFPFTEIGINPGEKEPSTIEVEMPNKKNS